VAYVKSAAESAGIAPKTLRTARESLGVESHRDGGRYGQYLWAMPGHGPAGDDQPKLALAGQGQA
jgi:hypothetical protein